MTVSFVRTAPAELGEAPDPEGVRCAVCGGETSAPDDRCGGYTNPLSLDACFVRNPHSTFFVRVGESDDGAVAENAYLGVRAGDVLTIDRSIEPTLGKLVLAACDGTLVLCRFTEHNGERFVVCGRSPRESVRVEKDGTDIWGVVVALARGL